MSRNQEISDQNHTIELLAKKADDKVEETEIQTLEAEKWAMKTADIIAEEEVMNHSIQVVQKNWSMVLSQHLIISNVNLLIKIGLLNRKIER